MTAFESCRKAKLRTGQTAPWNGRDMAKNKAAKPMKKDATKKPVKPVAKAASKIAPKAAKVSTKLVVKTDSKTKADKKKPVEKSTILIKKDAVQLKTKTGGAVKPIEDKASALKIPAAGAKSADKKASKLKNKKTETKDDDFDADLVSDGFGDSEIAEYEDDLKAVEEIDELEEGDLESDDDTEERDEEVYLTDSEGRRLCRVRDCDQVSTVDGYCRYHYLLLWKKIQIRKSILLDGKLDKYIIDLTTRYPDKYLEAIRKDLRSEKDFLSAIQELEIDESALGEMENQEEEAQTFAEEFRGIGEAPTAMDDDGDY